MYVDFLQVNTDAPVSENGIILRVKGQLELRCHPEGTDGRFMACISYNIICFQIDNSVFYNKNDSTYMFYWSAVQVIVQNILTSIDNL